MPHIQLVDMSLLEVAGRQNAVLERHFSQNHGVSITNGPLYVLCTKYPCTALFEWRFAELGTRQFCRDNVTMFSGHKVVIYNNITVFVWLLHLDTLRSKYFSIFFLVPEDLLRSPVVALLLSLS